jgi:hypothetical protein
MSTLVRKFITHKPAENPEDCQDSFCAEPEQGVFAVADGAGNSFFPREWAQCLTEHFARDVELALQRETFTQWLRSVHEEWAAGIERIATMPKQSFLVVNGYRGKKAAAAAFIGIHLGKPIEGKIPWRAVALGDSCLFHASAGGKVHKYPLTKSTEFAFDLYALSSYPDRNIAEPKFLRDDELEGRPPIVEGDFLIMASDALSRWLIRREEIGQAVWGQVVSLESKADFLQFIDQARTEKEEPMQNDDVALVVVRFGEPHGIYSGQRFIPTPAVPQVAAEGPPPLPPLPPLPDALSSAPKHSRISKKNLFSEIVDRKVIGYGAIFVAGLAVAFASSLWKFAELKKKNHHANERTRQAYELKVNKLQAEIRELDRRAGSYSGELTELRSSWRRLRGFVEKSAKANDVLRAMDSLQTPVNQPDRPLRVERSLYADPEPNVDSAGAAPTPAPPGSPSGSTTPAAK